MGHCLLNVSDHCPEEGLKLTSFNTVPSRGEYFSTKNAIYYTLDSELGPSTEMRVPIYLKRVPLGGILSLIVVTLQLVIG